MCRLQYLFDCAGEDTTTSPAPRPGESANGAQKARYP